MAGGTEAGGEEITMLFLPIFLTRSHPKCPSCHKDQDIKQVCRECDYEYKKEELNWITLVIATVLFLIIGILSLISGDYIQKNKIIPVNFGSLFVTSTKSLLDLGVTSSTPHSLETFKEKCIKDGGKFTEGSDELINGNIAHITPSCQLQK